MNQDQYSNSSPNRGSESRSQGKGVGMSNLILHIPHASLHIPDYSAFLLSRDAVDAEALHLTDLYTDELFLPSPGDVVIQADFSRVYCDVERFKSDALEPILRIFTMCKVKCY